MDISIVLEWENAVLAELDRTKALLFQIFTQVQNRPEEFELIILHNESQVSKQFIRDFVKSVSSELDFESKLPMLIYDVADAHYFQLKNQGVKIATGEKIIFFDSDIIPESNWMEVVLAAHESQPDSVISGYSYIDYADLMGKAFALSWFFPLPPMDSKLSEVNLIFSNNYLAPRKLMLENPYPFMEGGVTRGADVLLWERMIKKGVRFYCHSGARASHPSPNGLNHFVKRALAEGRDDFKRLFEPEFKDRKPFSRFFKIYLYRSRKAIRSSFTNGQRVALAPMETPLVAGIMFFYYQLYLAGGLITKAFPKYSQTNWKI